MKEKEGHQEDLLFVRDIFSELNKIYLRSSQQKNYELTPKDKIITEEAINALQQTICHWKETLDSTDTDFYYAFNLSTHWDYKTREELIRPLFVNAGLIQEDDSPDRLIFFTKLQSIFQFLQEDKYDRGALKVKHGDQYVICSVDYKRAFSVNLELVSAQYPALTAKGNKCAPQLLKEAHFEIPFGLDELKMSLTACLKKHCDTMLSSEVFNTMIETISLLYAKFNDVGCEIFYKKTLHFILFLIFYCNRT